MSRLLCKYFHVVSFFFIVFFLGGCEKRGLIDLNGSGSTQEPVDILSPITTSSLLNTDDIDTAKYLSPLDVKAFGQLLIETSEYDSPSEHRKTAFARAIFFNKNAPVFFPKDTSYKTFSAGTISLDQIAIPEVQKRYLNVSTAIDSLLGVQYVLYNKNTESGNGFIIFDNQTYRWQSSGTSFVPQFDVSIASLPSIHISSPAVQSPVRLSTSLTLRWTGGADTVRVIVRSVEQGYPSKVLFQLRLNENMGRVLIPKTMLALLPRDRSEFMFTVTSCKNLYTNLDGFPGGILIQTVTSHNILLQVKP